MRKLATSTRIMSRSSKTCSRTATLPSPTAFTSLPLYPLSALLSYLSECDGTCTLITNKTWTRRVLPLFALRRMSVALQVRSETSAKDDSNGNGNGNGKAETDHVRRMPQTRHSYRVYPVQDSETLLDRLNSRRLSKRLIRIRKGIQRRGDYVDSFSNVGVGGKPSCSAVGKAYRLGLTTSELARWEWHVIGKSLDTDDTESSGGLEIRNWPPDLELLMWRDDFQPIHQTTKAASSNPNPVPFPCGSRSGNVTIVLASYPRSGNTLLRTLLERTTLCVTGSDTRPDRTLSKALALQHNLVGEGVVRPSSLHPTYSHPSVGVVKTHWPERSGCLPYNCRRVILLVRNPYDAIDSYWNLCVTNTHTETVDESIYAMYAEKFRGLALGELKTWINFYSWWINECKDKGLDLCLIRYEDLAMDVSETFRDVMRFVLGVEELDAFWEGRIRHALDEEVLGAEAQHCTSRLGSYRPRNDESGQQGSFTESSISTSSTGGGRVPPTIAKSLRKKRYTDEILRQMHDTAAAISSNRGEEISLLKQFGYDIYEQDFPNNVESGTGMQFERIKYGGSSSTIRVNVGSEIRPRDDPYGRAMTNWRKGETAGDTEPFPTVLRLRL